MSPGNTGEAAEFLELLRRDGVVRDPAAVMTPLGGGVSSEIYRVQDGSERFVVKRALPKLRVQDDWAADVGRNRFEQLYISYVAGFLPDAVPALRAARPDHGYFAMEDLGESFVTWKQMLLAGRVEATHAQAAAEILGRIHRRSAGEGTVRQTFDTTANFHQLRVDPYLLTTGRRHPDLQELIETEAERLESTRVCLVHGDFSPKNILIGPRQGNAGERIVVVDCEVAWYGEPAFDAAFLLNHLMLKSLYHWPRDFGLARLIDVFWQAYTRQCEDVFDLADLEVRTVRLLLLLLLARVDGKSPAEYLTAENRKAFVREFVRRRLVDGRFSLALVTRAWFLSLRQIREET